MADVLEVTTVSLDVGCRPQAFCGERRLFLEEDATVHVSQEEIALPPIRLGSFSFVGARVWRFGVASRRVVNLSNFRPFSGHFFLVETCFPPQSPGGGGCNHDMI